jgi:hypothetical protein
MLVPLTLNASAGSGLGAGPATTEPLVMLYWLPWHGQSIVPLEIVLTRQPMCVQTALKHLNSPAAGWVTTTFSLVKILPLPTGISLVVASAPDALFPLDAALGAEEGALGAAPPVVPVVAPAAELLELLDPPELQALTAPARPTRPAPASRPRRVARVPCCGSCVTSTPVPLSSSA